MTDNDQSQDIDEQNFPFEGVTRRVFMGSSAAAGGLLLSGNVAGEIPSKISSEQSGGLSTSEQNSGLGTKDILQLSLNLIGADEVPSDTGIYVEGTEIETVLAGIDIKSPEIQLANKAGYDLALAHHPMGGWPKVNIADTIFNRGVELMVNQGVPKERAKKALEDRRNTWILKGNDANYRHGPSIAELLDQPLMNIHRPIDELSRRAFVEVINDLSANNTVADLKKAFYESVPEARAAKPEIVTALGRDSNEVGNIAIYHGAGTDGGEDVARAFYENGTDTVIYIHIQYDAVSSLHETYGDDKNLIALGHIVGDGVGFRMFSQALEAHGVDVTPISGADITGKVSGDDAGDDGDFDVGNRVPDVLKPSVEDDKNDENETDDEDDTYEGPGDDDDGDDIDADNDGAVDEDDEDKDDDDDSDGNNRDDDGDGAIDEDDDRK
jgi:putative NIF3 family GTP cyclohydrolase 1 type 2